jgi:hypothetical protein
MSSAKTGAPLARQEFAVGSRRAASTVSASTYATASRAPSRPITAAARSSTGSLWARAARSASRDAATAFATRIRASRVTCTTGGPITAASRGFSSTAGALSFAAASSVPPDRRVVMERRAAATSARLAIQACSPGVCCVGAPDGSEICSDGVCYKTCGSGQLCDPEIHFCCAGGACCRRVDQICGASAGTCAPLP